MVDTHCHIIPKIDDGAKSVEDSIKLIKEAKEAGFTDVIFTPHHITNYYEATPTEINMLTTTLQNVALKNNINIRFHSGMEIYTCEELVEKLKQGKLLTLANSNYMLVELPMNSKLIYATEILSVIKSLGYTVIIAHPERYSYVQEDINYAKDLVDNDFLLQCNYASIIGFYGAHAKETLKKLLKLNLVSFFGTDVHRPNSIYNDMPKIIRKLEKILPQDKLYKITTQNPQMIIDNKTWDF